MARPAAAAKQFNKLAVHLAGRRFFPVWAVIHHRGRRSGKEYATPVTAMPAGGTVVIALPWGRDTDWVRNVVAAGGCTLTWKGRDHDCTEPRFVGNEVADQATGMTRANIRGMKIAAGFLQLTLGPGRPRG